MAESLEARELLSYGGSPDLSYGTLGLAPYRTGADSSFVGQASATQADGKTVVIGSVIASPASGIGAGRYLAAARYNTDGSLDTGFGTGGYFTSATLSTLAGGPNTSSYYAFNGIAIQPDNEIVLTGILGAEAVVARLTTAGALDPTFGTAGVVTLGSYGSNDGKVDYGASVAILPNGQIAVGGSTVTTTQVSPAVAKLNADGSVDTSFGTSGTVIVAKPDGSVGFYGDPVSNSSGLVAQPDGKIVIVTNALESIGGGILATRYNVDGTLDPTFGTGGQSYLSTAFTQRIGFGINATSLAIQPDGKLVIGGQTFGQGMAVVRLNADGSPDLGFGAYGADILGGTTTTDSNATAIAFQADGKILLADRNNANVTRLKTDGLPDTSFGEGGTAKFPVSPGQIYNGLVGVSVLADGKIIAAQSQDSSSAFYGLHGLLRLMPKGAEGDYNNDGISDPAVLDYSLPIPAFLSPGSSGGSFPLIQIGDFGAPFTLPAPGAYDGGGISEVAVYRPGPGVFDVKPYDGGPDVITAFGTPGIGNTLPAPGDYDHSGQTELAIYSPAQGAFYYRPAGSTGRLDKVVPFGVAGAGQSIPAPADYFGTGQTDFAVYLVAQGAYLIRNPVTGEDYTIPFGTPGAGQAIPVPGDYDGSGFAELAVYVPASGDLIYRPHAGGADVIVPFGTPGIARTIPAPGDYDGSGHTEVAGYEPGSGTGQGTFSFLPASGGAAVSIALGTAGQSVPFSLGTDSVAVSGIGLSSGSANFMAGAVVPITQDVLDSLAGPSSKKAAKPGV